MKGLAAKSSCQGFLDSCRLLLARGDGIDHFSGVSKMLIGTLWFFLFCRVVKGLKVDIVREEGCMEQDIFREHHAKGFFKKRFFQRQARATRLRAKNQFVRVMKKALNGIFAKCLIFLAGQEGFEPPAPGFGVRCSNR